MPPRDKRPEPLTADGDERTTAIAAADVGAPVVEAMPDEFPVDFAEWAAGQPGPYRWLVAGYRQRVRARGELTAMKMRRVWDEGFGAFRKEGVR